MKGFGTVITGTLISGKVNVGDEIMIFPSRITSRVRGIQMHGNSVNTVAAGSRTAINFQGLDRETINRGNVLSTPDTLHPSFMVDAELLYLASNAKPAGKEPGSGSMPAPVKCSVMWCFLTGRNCFPAMRHRYRSVWKHRFVS